MDPSLLLSLELRHFYCYEGGGTEEKWYPLLRRPSFHAGNLIKSFSAAVPPKGQSQIVHFPAQRRHEERTRGDQHELSLL